MPDPLGQCVALPKLTERELEIAGFVSQGLSNHEISQKAFITRQTVGCHLANIYRKLKIKSRAALAVWAVREGIV